MDDSRLRNEGLEDDDERYVEVEILELEENTDDAANDTGDIEILATGENPEDATEDAGEVTFLEIGEKVEEAIVDAGEIIDFKFDEIGEKLVEEAEDWSMDDGSENWVMTGGTPTKIVEKMFFRGAAVSGSMDVCNIKSSICSNSSSCESA